MPRARHPCHPDGTGEKFCYQTCTVAQNCVFAGAGFDADKFACQNGLRVCLGCLSDAECASQNATYVGR
jgi:hypothetical protein